MTPKSLAADTRWPLSSPFSAIFSCVRATVNVLKSKKELCGNTVYSGRIQRKVRKIDQRLIWSHEDYVLEINIVSLSGT